MVKRQGRARAGGSSGSGPPRCALYYVVWTAGILGVAFLGGRQCLRAALVDQVVPLPVTPATAGDAAAAAASAGEEIDVKVLARLLSLDQKIGLAHGAPSGCGYTGLTREVPLFRIPELRENDGPQGFRGKPGKSTAYPSGLAMGATFDPELVFRWGREVSREFVEKGANVLLGPGLNLMRVPRNGRTFEYLSGEDPHLGAQMAGAVVRGMQSVEGVIATAKHFVLNNQETDRMSVSAVVDPVTLHEMYYAPFRAAVRAGVGAVMCAYNRVNGVYACEDDETLTGTLRDDWGFKGFVMSDWGATHSNTRALLAGLDQEMPLGVNFGSRLKAAASSNATVAHALTRSTERILHAMHQANLLGTKTPPCLTGVDTSSLERHRLAVDLGVAGSVLLRNSGRALPLSLGHKGSPLRILLLGRAANDTQVVTGGGSGHVEAGPHVVTALAGLQRTINMLEAGGGVVDFDDGSDPDRSVAAAKQVDVAVVVLATSSEEGADRPSLQYLPHENKLVEQVSAAAPKTVIVALAPGPMVLPWTDQVDAILAMFFPGQGFGDALGRLLFGIESPSGRLPVSFPREGHEVQFTAAQYPGVNKEANYSEGSLIGYRWFDAHNVAPRFAFGHGLSYVDFAYSPRASVARVPNGWILTAQVTNEGAMAAREVVQVYLAFGSGCDHPQAGFVRAPKKLVAFTRVLFAPREMRSVLLFIETETASDWSPRAHAFRFPHHCKDRLEFWVGPSSSDIRIKDHGANMWARLHLLSGIS
ncbi:Thermostable beta-glucosidase B (Beta-D-glucoside glucohydrolase) (Cellobiase) (Gentiobiase), partial [Durusdinium trenchii]